MNILDQLKLLLTPPQNEVWLYWSFADHMKHHLFPYVGFFPEYPPFSLAFFYAPMLIAVDNIWYTFLYHIEVFLFIALGGLLVYLLKKREGFFAYLFFIWVLQASDYKLVFDRFDVFPAILTSIAVYLFFRAKKEASGWFFLFLGTMTKIYPAVLFPYMLYKAKNKLSVLWFIIPMVITNVYFYVATHGAYMKLFTMQGGRPLQIESVAMLAYVPLVYLGKLSLTASYAQNSWSLVIPSMLQTGVSLGILALAGLPILCKLRSVKSYKAEEAAFILVLAFILINKVLSPQYFLWLIPFMPFLSFRKQLLGAVIIGITSWMFSFYDGAQSLNLWLLTMIWVRNFLLVALYLWSMFLPEKKSAVAPLPRPHRGITKLFAGLLPAN